jgi:hypothetical protein
MLSHAHTGEKVRSDAFDLLVLVGEKILELPSTNETEDEHDVTMNDYLLLLAAGLAASSNHVCLQLLESLYFGYTFPMCTDDKWRNNCNRTRGV